MRGVHCVHTGTYVGTYHNRYSVPTLTYERRGSFIIYLALESDYVNRRLEPIG